MAAPSPSEAKVWRTAGGDNARRGRFAGEVELAPRPRRQLQAQGAIQASVVFDAEGTAFVADLAGGVQAFAATGRQRWQVNLGSGVSATPALDFDGAVLFVGTHAGEVLALEAATGVTRWHRSIPSRRDPRILSDLLLLRRRGLVVFSSWSGRVFALDAASGEPRFDWDAGISPRSAVSADEAENLYAMRAVAGRGVEVVRWSTEGEERVLHREPEDSRGAGRALVAAGPVLDEERDTAYLLLNHERVARLLAWSLGSGAARWQRELAAAVQATPTVLPDGSVAVGDLAGGVQVFGPDGVPRCAATLDCDFLLAGGVSPGGGRFVIGDPLGGLHLVEADGTRRQLFEAPRSLQARPSFDPFGNLHVPCTDRIVYVIGGRPRAA